MEYKKLIFADGFFPGRPRIMQKNTGTSRHLFGAAKVQIIEGETAFPDTLYCKVTEDNPIGYSWIVPLPNKKMNIGVGNLQTKTVPDSWLDNLKISENLNGKVVASGGGVMPVKPVVRVQNGDTYLFGNSAGMVYSLNGEGLKYIADVSDTFARAIISGKKLNFKWRISPTYFKLKFASIALKGICSGSRIFGRSLYPFACKASPMLRKYVNLN